MGNALLMTSIEQGLIFSVLSMGLYISYKVLDIADLSVEGSFPLGAFIFAVLCSMGVNTVLAIIVSFIWGLL